VLARLEKMGLRVEVPPQATFYIWLDLSSLEPPLNSGLVFFEELLKVCAAARMMLNEGGRRKQSVYRVFSSISTLLKE